jgi:septal ring factor EnvC (AmiA/AmiB activator)
MNYAKMYKEKKKRVRDPNLPPPPNLMSHDKTIRGMQANLETTQLSTQQQQNQIEQLKREVRQANYRIELLTNQLRNMRDNNKG